MMDDAHVLAGPPLLTLASVVLLAAFAPPLLISRQPIWMRPLWRVAALALVTLLVTLLFGSPLKPGLRPGGDVFILWQQAVEIGWWIAAARGLAGASRLFLVLHGPSRESQLLSDLIGGVLYLAAALAIVDVVFAVPVGGLIATSGVIAVVIGLALQNTLSDVFSGIAIDLERPYKVGDSLWIEGGVEGRVREVNWRSTLVTTSHGDLAVVPNSVMAKARLVNHNLPGPARRTSVEVRIDPRVMPERCRAALDAALVACCLPVADPAPSVAQTALHGDGAIYEIAFSVPDSGTIGPARTEILGQVQRHLFHAAIPLAVCGMAEVPRLTLPDAERLLAESDLFGIMAPADRDLLAARMHPLHLAPGDSLFVQDEPAEALYVLASGTVAVLRRDPDGSEIMRRTSPGISLGAISLVMDQPYGASASALTAVKAFRLDKSTFSGVLAAHPELVPVLEDWARRSIATLRADVGARDDQSTPAVLLLSRIRSVLRRFIGDVAREASA